MELSRKPCPFVDCGSSDAFAYNTDKMTGRCFSCERGYPHRTAETFDWASVEYPTNRSTNNMSVERDGLRPNMTQQSVWSRTGTNLTDMTATAYRGLTPATMKMYGVKS